MVDATLSAVEGGLSTSTVFGDCVSQRKLSAMSLTLFVGDVS